MRKVVIYWATRDYYIMGRIRRRFGITAGTTVNGESPAEIKEEDFPLLEETARRGFVQIRKYNPRLECLLKNPIYV